jgi:hypothetical protein
MNLAVCPECQPATVIGVNVGIGFPSHTVGNAVHKAKIIEVPDSPADLRKEGESIQSHLDRLAKTYRDRLAAGEIKSYDGPSFEVVGGLGDVLHSLHHTDRYSALAALGPKERRLVVVLSHNPHVTELFRWHPKAAQLDVLYLGYRPSWGAEARRRMGLPEPMPARHRVPTAIEYHPAPQDAEPLAQLAETRYIAFCLTGSANDGRDIPPPVAERAADLALKAGFGVVLFGRDYGTVVVHGQTKIVRAHAEGTLAPRAGVTSMVNRLSVPGTCRALALAEGVFCAHSALCLASWWMRRPTFVLYNDAQARLFEHPLGYAFGRDHPETRHGTYKTFTAERFGEWLGQIRDGAYGWRVGR